MLTLIAHAAWAPGRKAGLARLREHLPHAEVLSSRGPEHAAIWSRRLWERAREIDPLMENHVCLLNDDVTLAPDFEARLARAVAAVPDECISLHSSNPNLAGVDGAWARCYHYSGPAVVLPPGAAASLLKFVYALPWSMLSRMNEDNIAHEWAWSRQRPFWYLLPSPVSHDVSIPSTLGYDGHPHRVPVVLGPELDPRVSDRDAVPFVELDWCRTQKLQYRREVIQAGRQLCTMCVEREGVVGHRQAMICLPCLAELNNTVARAKQ